MNARVVGVAVSTKISARVSTPCWEMGSLTGRPQPRLACALKRHRAAPSRIATPSSGRDVMTSGQ